MVQKAIKSVDVIQPSRQLPWVAEAKRQVIRVVGIDMVAGPSEIVGGADAKNDPEDRRREPGAPLGIQLLCIRSRIVSRRHKLSALRTTTVIPSRRRLLQPRGKT